jgi:phosphoglycolate phosphatase
MGEENAGPPQGRRLTAALDAVVVSAVGRTRYDRLFWDLDGTIADSREGMLRSVAYALEALGRTVDDGTLERFLGPPVVRSFRAFYGLDGEELSRAVSLYRDRYLQLGWRESRVMPGIGTLLEDLRRAGVPMAVATVKPRPAAGRILAHLGLSACFDALYAPSAYGLAVDKSDVLAMAVGGQTWQGPGCAAMVGDHEDDMRAARARGLDGIAVLYGYGDRQALRAASPTAMAADAADLRRVLFTPRRGAD